MVFVPKPALGIVVDSPQPDEGGARTCNGKPDPLGNVKKNKTSYYRKKFHTTPKRIEKSR